MRIYMLGDTHFGIFPARGEAWLTMMMSFMYDVYIPFLQKHVRPGDVLVHTGDVFDNRNSIHVIVLNKTVRLFEDLAKILPVYVLVGNHDMWAMQNATVNSTASIRNIPGVTLVEEPVETTFGDKTALLLPWVHGKANELELLAKYSGKDLLFCHSDLVGARTQANPTRPIDRHVCTIDDFQGYRHVYSGHIHIRQQIKNFTFIGAPYHMDRNDAGNEKGFYVYDTVRDAAAFVSNTHSPEFRVVDIKTEEDMDKLTPELLDKDYVDVKIANSLLIDKPNVRTRLDKVLTKHKIARVEWVDDSYEADAGEINTLAASQVDLDVVRMGHAWINAQRFADNDLFDATMKTMMAAVLEDAERIRRAAS